MNAAIQPARLGSKLPPRRRVGELLIAAGVLRPSDVQRIVARQRENGRRFGETAVELALVTEEQLARALAQQVGYPCVEYGASRLAHALAAAYEPFCAYSEALRTLRSQLLMRWFGPKQRAVAVSSARHDEGSSLVAANLAVVFAQLGENTLLLDANLRAPVQHRLFGLDGRYGLADLIAFDASLEATLCKIDPFDKLTIMSAGAMPPNPQEILSSAMFADTLEKLALSFDVIIIDTPPLLEFADGAIVAQRAGACVLSARRHRTSALDLNRSKTLLGPTSATLLGVVLHE
jgi:protein-tyrosine kinase